MRAIERTTKLFLASLRDSIPGVRAQVEKSVTDHGRSHYVHIRDQEQNRYWKVRISDHPVGMNRARSGREDLYLHARAKPDAWTIWLGKLRRQCTPTPRPR